MGSPSSEKGRDENERQHTVSVGEFWLGETEVTNRQYRLFKPGHDSKSIKGHSLNGDDQPVVGGKLARRGGLCKMAFAQDGQAFSFADGVGVGVRGKGRDTAGLLLG